MGAAGPELAPLLPPDTPLQTDCCPPNQNLIHMLISNNRPTFVNIAGGVANALGRRPADPGLDRLRGQFGAGTAATGLDPPPLVGGVLPLEGKLSTSGFGRKFGSVRHRKQKLNQQHEVLLTASLQARRKLPAPLAC